jgi:hypothetical protein
MTTQAGAPNSILPTVFYAAGWAVVLTDQQVKDYEPIPHLEENHTLKPAISADARK